MKVMNFMEIWEDNALLLLHWVSVLLEVGLFFSVLVPGHLLPHLELGLLEEAGWGRGAQSHLSIEEARAAKGR